MDEFDGLLESMTWRAPNSNASPRKSNNRDKPRRRTPRKSPRKPSPAVGQENVVEGDTLSNVTYSSASTKKSHGISPSNFHRRPLSSPAKESQMQRLLDDIKATSENNVLVQEKMAHLQSLEARRKHFRKGTTLKTWPLQDLAMENLRHLDDPNTQSGSQFHGGDYLSSESTSSTASNAPPKRRLDVSKTGSSNSRDESQDLCSEDSLQPLWSRQPRIFATEKAQGKRKYLVGHFGRIADWYWRKCVNKHLYEIITQDTPCRLYLDLEYSKEFNPGVDAAALLNEFRDELSLELKTQFDVSLSPNRIIDLDSSTPSKFSRHWILDLDDDGLFLDAPTCGRFMKRLVGRLAEDQATQQLQERAPTLAEHLFVKTKDPVKKSCFIDLGVYTRNRLFRCFASSKFGKANTLQIADTNTYPLESLPKRVSGDEFQNCESDTVKTKLTLQEYKVANDWEPHARVLAATLVVPLGRTKSDRLFRVSEEAGTIFPSQHSSKKSTYSATHSIFSSKTPLPSLDQFVLSVLGCRGGVPGSIRAWSMEYEGTNGDVPMSITYHMSRNRYCELVGRSHKSNNIFWTIVFDSWTCLQGCHDPECFGRGCGVPIPQELLPNIQAEFDAWQDEELDKALLALNLDESNQAVDSASLHSPRDTSPSAPQLGSAPPVLVDEVDEATADVLVNTSLSDEALLLAIQANPELFP
eukprot:Nitzschia sp. Nitz4//scaffold183_size43938//30651//32738//NITZ4_007273-RA/size43938-processed-gene-0.7-mRNA-1//1//CDS//3329539623//8006//frame0